MKYILLFALLSLFSCVSGSGIVGLHTRTIQEGESTTFTIYCAQGYFYKDQGFILVENKEGERVMIRCHIDTLHVIHAPLKLNHGKRKD